MEFKVEVRSDPYVSQQTGVGFFSGGDAAVGMQMGGNMSSPAAVGFQVHDNSHMQSSHAAVSMNMGMPAMSMQINDVRFPQFSHRHPIIFSFLLSAGNWNRLYGHARSCHYYQRLHSGTF